jgi:hypothetical protein
MNITSDITYEDEESIGYIYNLMNINTNTKIGYLNIIINYNEKSSIITDFYCMDTNKGHGSILLNFLINQMKKLQIKNITLDDMTNKYRNLHNIYTKFGFNYIYDVGPEMILLLNI